MSVSIAVLLILVTNVVRGYDNYPSKETGYKDHDDRLLKLEKNLEEQAKIIRYQNQQIQALAENDKELRNTFRNTVNDMNTKITQNEIELKRQRNQIMTLTNRDQENQRKFLVLQEICDQRQNGEKEQLVHNVNISNKTDKTQREVNDVKPEKVPIPGKYLQRGEPNTSKPTVAFYAYMSADEANPSDHHTLVFDVEKVDIGDGYNPYTGTFTVPIDGVYVFSYSLRVLCHAWITVEIVKNDSVEGSIIADAEESCDNDMTTGNVIVVATKGDAVFVRTPGTGTGKGDIHNGGNGYSSFSGWLLG